jgi:hypothetical protein
MLSSSANVGFIVVTCRRTDGRIPLKDLIRFKERQWFVEELEVGEDQWRRRSGKGPVR